MEKRSQFQLNTGGHCFFCFQSVEVEVGDNEDDCHSVLKSVPPLDSDSFVTSSLFNLCGHLQLNVMETIRLASKVETLSSNFPRPSSKLATEVKVPLCGHCRQLNSKFEKLFRLQEKVRLEMDYWLKGIQSRLRGTSALEAGRKLEAYGKHLNTNPGRLIEFYFHSGIVKELRKVLGEKCKKLISFS